MKLSAPTKPIFLISLILFILAVLGHFAIGALGEFKLWLAFGSYVVLAIGCILKGL